MELNQARYFLEVAKTQHITRSAEKLHIAQPALSQAIRRLEKDLRVPLFVPKGRNIVLTEYGKYLKEQLEPIIKQFDSIPEKLQTMASLESETIHLNVLAASALVTEAIIKYKKIHENIKFQLFQNAQDRIYDIGTTTTMFSKIHNESSPDEFVCTEKIFLAVPKSHIFAKAKSICLEDAAEEGFISLMGSRQLRLICDRYCHKAGFEPRIIFESDSPSAVQNMIAANTGIGFWPEFTWGSVDLEKVKLVEISGVSLRRDIVIDRMHNKPDNSAVDGFFDFLKQFFIDAQENALKRD